MPRTNAATSTMLGEVDWPDPGNEPIVGLDGPRSQPSTAAFQPEARPELPEGELVGVDGLPVVGLAFRGEGDDEKASARWPSVIGIRVEAPQGVVG